jgi:type II secretory pathway component PulF
MTNMKQSTQLWIGWLTTIGALISFILMMFVVPEFEELFEGFGAELPVFTQLILNVHNQFYLLALPGVIGNLLIQSFKNRIGWWLVGFTAVMGVLLIPLTVIAMYLPVFEMGNVVAG